MIINLNKLFSKEIVEINPRFEKLFLNKNQLKGDAVVIVHNRNNITSVVPGFINERILTIKDSDRKESIIIRDSFHEVKGIKFLGVTLNYRKERELTGRKYGMYTDWI